MTKALRTATMLSRSSDGLVHYRCFEPQTICKRSCFQCESVSDRHAPLPLVTCLECLLLEEDFTCP